MSGIHKDRPSHDPTSLKTMRSAALQCLQCCKSLSEYARLGEESWLEACKKGSIQTLINGLAQAVEMGSEIEREPRLTLGEPCTFGNVTARNAHVAALHLGRRISSKIDTAVFAHGSLEGEEVRAVLYSLFGYKHDPHYNKLMRVNCNFEAWQEAIESEADRAPCVVLQKTERRKKTKETMIRDKRTEARDKWVYEQCCKGVAYDTIARRLPKQNKNWQAITTKQGILACARKYAERNNLPLPPPRQSPT